MAVNLQLDQALTDSAAQFVKDEGGAGSPLSLTLTVVGVGTTSSPSLLDVRGDTHLEKRGSPKLGIRSRGDGTQHYSLRATNADDPAGGRRFVIRNESAGRDQIVLDSAGNASIAGDLRLEKRGSPKLGIRSRGNGTQHYSLRATNDDDPAGGRRLVIRNEDADDGAGRDEVVLDSVGNVTFTGDIRLAGADCAEAFAVEPGPALDAGTVMVIGDSEQLRQCTEAHDRRVAGVVSGAGDYRPGIILGNKPSEPWLPLALTGRVHCKVDAGPAAIDVGDLLTTSAEPGHAMKATDPVKSSGALIGKALRPLPGGRSLLPILIALH